MEYTEVLFTPGNDDFTPEILSAVLAEAGYEMFENKGTGVAAYIPTSGFDSEILTALLDPAIPAFAGLTWESLRVPFVNWNAEWEKNFEPVEVEDKLLIRAEYHAPQPGIEHEIVIRPGMAFGTGHHATTWMMASKMMNLPFNGTKVLDMGTGSGVLAILAQKLGAAEVLAVDYDDNAAENALINTQLNNTPQVKVQCGTMQDVRDTSFDTVLANINRNIILQDVAAYADAMKQGGNLLVSGFYTEDLGLVAEAARQQGLVFEDSMSKNNWCLAAFRKNQ